MNQAIQKNNHLPLKTLAISCLAVFFSFLWQGNKGFNLWDEGYLWYGVQRVLNHEVPILDFLAYDPGRYYWSAAILNIWGDAGIMSLRATVAVFQTAGLCTGLLLVANSAQGKVRNDLGFWLISAATILVWMFPRHKLFDISISIFLIGILTYMLRDPQPKRCFIAGLCIGLIAVFGRNHGMYGAMASFGAIAWLSINNQSGPGFIKMAALWASGVAVGFLPVVFMMLMIQGFAAAFWESIRYLLETKSTNLPLPVPWPWAVDVAARPVAEAARGILTGLFFIGTLVFAAASLIWVVRQKLKGRSAAPALAASAFLAFPYAHFAFSRADIGHLAQGIFPLLVGCLVILSTARERVKWSLALVLFAASYALMLVLHPGWQCLTGTQCVAVEISGKKLQVDSATASDIALLRQLAGQYAKNGQTFVAMPFWPGAYALLERKAPVWEIYAPVPRPAAFERKEIERIRTSRPGFALMIDLPLDGRDELRFKNTHPLTHEYIIQNFLPVPFHDNAAYQIFTSKNAE